MLGSGRTFGEKRMKAESFRGGWLILACAALLLGGRTALAADAADPMAKLYNGNALYNMKLYSAAVAEYSAFLGENPGHAKTAEARYGLALSYYGSGNYGQAEPLLKGLLENFTVGDKQQLIVLLGECVLRLRGPVEAEKIFARPDVMQGTNTYFRNMGLAFLTDTLYRQSKWQEAAEVADRARPLLPADDVAARVGYQGAYARYQLKEMDKAAAGFAAIEGLVTNKAMEAQVAFLLGESLREGGKPEKAEPAYFHATAKAKGGLKEESLFRLGFVRFQLGRYDTSVQALQTCLGSNPSNRVMDATLYLGRAWLEQKNFGEAEQKLRRVSESNNVFAAEGTLWLGRTYSRQNRTDDALKVLTNSVPRFGGDPLLADLLFDQGTLFMAKQKYPEASASFGRLEGERRTWSRLDESLRLHALCTHRTKDYGTSIALCNQFFTAFTNHAAAAEVLFIKAESQYLQNPAAPDEALKLYRQFQAQFPKDPQNGDAVSLRIGQILHFKGEWAEALKLLLPLADKDTPEAPNKVFAEVKFLIGDCYFHQEKWAEAVVPLEAYVKKAAQEQPNVDIAFLELAISQIKLGKPEPAMSNLEQLTGRYPKSQHLALALTELGRLYYEAKRPGNAQPTLERVAKEFPDCPQRPQAEYYRGWLNLDANRDAQAETNFLQVVQRAANDPLAPDSRLQLGLITLRAQRFNDSWGHFASLQGTYTNFAKLDEAYYSGGMALARMNNHDAAISQFKTVLSKYPKSPMADRAAYEMAWCQRRANRNDEAVKAYDELLARYPSSPLAERARFEKAELTFDKGNYDAVVAQLKETIAGAKDKAVKEQAVYRLGWAYLSQGNAAAAAKTFEALVAEFPETERAATAHYQAGEMRMKLKEYESARDHFTAALAARNAKEIRESALLRQGETQSLTGKWGDAMGSYSQFQGEFATSKWIQQARFGAGWAGENNKQYDWAINEYRKVLAERGTDEISARAQFQIGECLFALQRYDQAVQELVRVDVNFRYPSWSGKALYEVGRVLELQGDKVKAAEQYKIVMDRFPKEDVGAAARTRLFELQAGGTKK
jgi:TolA-binding protein